MKGLRERCAGHPALAGREDLVLGAVRRRATDLEGAALDGLAAEAGAGVGGAGGAGAAAAAPLNPSSRARTHAQSAALGAATVAVLRPLVRDDALVAAALAEHWGGLASPAAAAALGLAAAWTRDPYPAAARRLASLRTDWGGAAPRARLVGGPAHPRTVLILPGPCLYAAALDAVGAGGGGLPFLAAACCSADGSWLAAGVGSNAGKATYTRSAWVGAGDGVCVLEVRRRGGG